MKFLINPLLVLITLIFLFSNVQGQTPDSIVITPDGSVNLKAGQSLTYSAVVYDSNGNVIENAPVMWTMYNCTNCIGYFNDSVLTVTKTGQGRVLASYGGISTVSGLITVTPGDLYRMVLYIADSQFVGYPFQSSASIILYDAYNNLKYDYNLSLAPISLITTEGSLDPDIISSSGLQIGGVVRLLSAGVTYSGTTAQTGIYADNGSVVSNQRNIFYNGYDILDALNIQGNTISEIFAGHEVSLRVPVQNRGNIIPGVSPVLKAGFMISGGLSQITFTPHANGQVDTATIILPVATQYPVLDTLMLELESSFNAYGETFTVVDTQYFPIEILGANVFNLVEDSFMPDSILTGKPFEISFEVFSDGFDRDIDSTEISISIYDESLDTYYPVYSGKPSTNFYQSGVIGYANLAGLLDSQVNLMNGWMPVEIDYKLYSSGNVFTLENPITDSIYVINDPGLSYISGSLSPGTIYGGTDISFSFEVDHGNNLPLTYYPNLSRFTLSGSDFNTTTNLFLENNVFIEGLNTFESGKIFIPEELVGQELMASAIFAYSVDGVVDTLTFMTVFDSTGVVIEVVTLPVVQIISTRMIAPNVPMVNTGQEIQLVSELVNLSTSEIDSLVMNLVSDGGSVFEPSQVIYNIPAHDTVEVIWDITVSSIAGIAEVFRVDIISNDLVQLPPVDNIDLINIESPAELEMAYQLFGVQNNLLDYGDDFTMNIELVNRGTASVTDGAYLLVVTGLDLNGPDTLSGVITPDKHIDFSFEAPAYDTTINFEFILTEIPIDLNTALPAITASTNLNIPVRVLSSTAELIVNIEKVSSSLVLPGRKKALFDLEITNSGISSITEIVLKQIEIQAQGELNGSVSIRDILNIGNTGFYEDDRKVTITTASNDRMIFYFDDYIISPGETKFLTFIAEFKETDENTVSIFLNKSDIKAYFTGGPNAGLSPEIGSNIEGESLISEPLVLTGTDLEKSFIAEYNPFNPYDEIQAPLNFSYELISDAPVEFWIFTLVGEEVYYREYASGSPGGMAGQNIVTWDGRNDEGYMVLNGIYIAMIKNSETGEYSRIKIAVVK